MQNEPNNPWTTILRAAKDSGSRRADVDPRETPETFVANIRSMRADLWSLAKSLFWCRWSLICALAAVLLYILSHLWLAPGQQRSIPIPSPPSPLSP